MILNQGEHMGLHWIEIDNPSIQDHNLDQRTVDFPGPIIVISMNDNEISTWAKDRLKETGHKSYTQYIKSKPQLYLYDPCAVFPGRKISYYDSSPFEFDLDKWAKENLSFPDNLELEFDIVPYKWTMAVKALTVKNGSLTKVRKIIPKDQPFNEAIVPIVKFLERNCPKPSENEDVAITCGSHLNILLGQINQTAVEAIRLWMAKPSGNAPAKIINPWETKTNHKIFKITPSMMFEDVGIQSFQLIKDDDSDYIMCEVTTAQGIKIVDDQKGTTVSLRAQLPDTVINALKGRSLSAVVDFPWAKDLKIKTAKSKDNEIIMRLAVVKEELKLPDRKNDDSIIKDALQSFLDHDADICKSSSDALPVIEKLDPGQLLAVMTTLVTSGKLDMEPYGFPGWVLGANLAGIRVIESPQTNIKTIIEKAISNLQGNGNEHPGDII